MNNVAPDIRLLPELPAEASPLEIIRAGVEIARGPVALACSFSAEDVAIIDLLHEAAPRVTVFALDTGRLNEETYAVAEAVAERYGVKVDWYFPERKAVERLVRQKGPFSFRESLENRHECCHIRKIEPLQRALKGLSGWVTGLRREQSVTRSDAAPIEIDQANGNIFKINPLIEWTEKELWDYIKSRRLPVNRLHSQGYPSIGCAPCTRAIEPGEHPRAGRWWWEDPEHKECGLHKR
jgi:phosphoadenosine phosphosulfate reductase